MSSQQIAGRNRLVHLGAVLGLGAALTAAACSGSGSPAGRNPAAPSAVEAPASVDHAGSGSHKHFTAGISPTTVSANDSAVLSVTVTTCGTSTQPACVASDQDLARVEIVVPDALEVTAVGNFGGDKVWTSAWTSGQTVVVGAATGGGKLAPDKSVTFDIAVNTPSVCETFVFQAPRGSPNPLPDPVEWNFDFYGALSVEVTGCAPPEEEDCPAAPSIANAYLKSLGIEHHHPEYGNITAAVADHMGGEDGRGTDFSGFEKCDPGYAGAVIAFVNEILDELGISYP